MPTATLEQTANIAVTWGADFDLASYAPKVTIIGITVQSDDDEDAFNVAELIRKRADKLAFVDRMRLFPCTTIGAVGYYIKPITIDAEREKLQVRVLAKSAKRNLRVQITFAW